MRTGTSTLAISQPEVFPHQQWALPLGVYQLNMVFASIEVPPGLSPFLEDLIDGLDVAHTLIFEPLS